MNKHELFTKELKTFKHEDIKEFTKVIIDDAPDYFFRVPASSTGKYHPKYALGDRGLARHTKAVLRFYNHLMSIEQNYNMFSEREIDLGRIACIAHDIVKSGTQEYYNEKSNNGENTVFTVFNHPLLAAKYILSYKNKYLSEEELRFIALAIGSHMGEWNTNKHEPDIVLPKPKTDMQKIVHLADYLASRKDIDVSFIDDEYAYPSIEPGDFKLTFGKHSGTMLKDVPKDYLKWLASTDLKEPLKTYVKEILETN